MALALPSLPLPCPPGHMALGRGPLAWCPPHVVLNGLTSSATGSGATQRGGGSHGPLPSCPPLGPASVPDLPRSGPSRCSHCLALLAHQRTPSPGKGPAHPLRSPEKPAPRASGVTPGKGSERSSRQWAPSGCLEQLAPASLQPLPALRALSSCCLTHPGSGCAFGGQPLSAASPSPEGPSSVRGPPRLGSARLPLWTLHLVWLESPLLGLLGPLAPSLLVQPCHRPATPASTEGLPHREPASLHPCRACLQSCPPAKVSARPPGPPVSPPCPPGLPACPEASSRSPGHGPLPAGYVAKPDATSCLLHTPGTSCTFLDGTWATGPPQAAWRASQHTLALQSPPLHAETQAPRQLGHLRRRTWPLTLPPTRPREGAREAGG